MKRTDTNYYTDDNATEIAIKDSNNLLLLTEDRSYISVLHISETLPLFKFINTQILRNDTIIEADTTKPNGFEKNKSNSDDRCSFCNNSGSFYNSLKVPVEPLTQHIEDDTKHIPLLGLKETQMQTKMCRNCVSELHDTLKQLLEENEDLIISATI